MQLHAVAKRGGLTIVSLLAGLAIWAVPASAAGPPTSVSAEIGWPPGITHTEVKGTANPNGATTSASIEYRQESTGTWVLAQTTAIGSGTTTVNLAKMLNGLKPMTYYSFRVSATNSFGTVYSVPSLHFTEHERNRWGVYGQPKAHAVTLAGEGTATLEYKVGSTAVKTECAAHGSGTLNHEEAVGDSFQMVWESCVISAAGAEPCKAIAPTEFKLDGSFTSQVTSVPMPRCSTEASNLLVFSEPFFVTVPFESFQVIHPVTLTDNATRNGTTAVSITVTGSWKALGEDSGKKWGVFFG